MDPERKQFTFYESFYKAARRLKNKQQRCELYDAICTYALYGQEPDVDKLPDAVAIAFELAVPTLLASWRKSQNGKQGGRPKKPKSDSSSTDVESKQKANGKQTESKNKVAFPGCESEGEKENEVEVEVEKEVEVEVENECYNPITPKSSPTPPVDPPRVVFADFWEIYPVKVHETEAMIAFGLAKQDQPAIMDGLNRWLRSGVWRTVRAPSPDAFIRNRMWEREPGNGGGAL